MPAATHAVWSLFGAEACIRVLGLDREATVTVRPLNDAARGELPAMAGRVLREGRDLCFVPRFAFSGGLDYEVHVDAQRVAVLSCPTIETTPTTKVVGVYPSADDLPRNVLRFYIWFSASMSEGSAASCVRLEDDNGVEVLDAFLRSDYELWDKDHRRLTVLLDPARIKRGLVGHMDLGYALRCGTSVQLVIDEGFRDASGTPLATGTRRRYRVGDDERRHVEPQAWQLKVPPARIREPFVACFDRPLDHGLLLRCLRVLGPKGVVSGHVEVGEREGSWSFLPEGPWMEGRHRLVVDGSLEDLAGNSLARVFDRDNREASDDPRALDQAILEFFPC